MNIDEIIKLSESINPNDVEGSKETLLQLNEIFNKYAEDGKKIITDRMSEVDFAKARTALVSTLVSYLVLPNGAKGLVSALLEDSLVLYTDTFFTAMLGFLAENEVL